MEVLKKGDLSPWYHGLIAKCRECKEMVRFDRSDACYHRHSEYDDSVGRNVPERMEWECETCYTINKVYKENN